jgi:hypothetical protein
VEKLQHGHPGRHESWRELAEHSLTHDNLLRPPRRRFRLAWRPPRIRRSQAPREGAPQR